MQTNRGSLVLIVEDDAEIRGGMRRLLRSLGFRVIEAEDGDAAYDLAACAGELCAVVTDSELPTLGDLLRRFGSDERLRGVPLVIVDDDAESLDLPDGVKAGDVKIMSDYESFAEFAAEKC